MMIEHDLLSLNMMTELSRIVSFIQAHTGNARLVVGVSGGIDSDVVSRLCVRAVGTDRVRLFSVRQTDMDPRHLENARHLASELGTFLVELALQRFPSGLLHVLETADPLERFCATDGLDLGKAKNSLRTWVYSMYAERGYLAVGCSNRTEIETGFYLPFGDGVSHIMPIAHLYKTQVRWVAEAIGTRSEVLDQPASAGYWIGETDLEDLAFWMFHGAPVLEALKLTADQLSVVQGIHHQLSFEALDKGLAAIGKGAGSDAVAQVSGLDHTNAERLLQLVRSVPAVKGRPLRVRLA